MPYIYILPSPNKPKRLVSQLFDSPEEARQAAGLVETKSESKPEIIEVHSKEAFKNSFKMPDDVKQLEVLVGQTLEFKRANQSALLGKGGIQSLVTQMTRPSLDSMSTDVKREVRTGFTLKEAARTSEVSSLFHHAMQPLLQKHLYLLELAVQGNAQAFLDMVNKEKDLNIFTQSIEGTALSRVDYSHRTIIGSSYQALLGAGDAYLLVKLKDPLEADPKSAIAQFKQQFPQKQFPHFWQALEEADEKKALEILKYSPPVKTYDFPALMKKVASDPFNRGCALQYRAELPKPGEALGLEDPIKAGYFRVRGSGELAYINEETKEY